ncbi:hypothetical protein C8Q75DRAFT_737813 [Abortiporus biennis]|nr:hypothetical protein C8Q75DRAFT_737813 [Abortiporus biennis]
MSNAIKTVPSYRYTHTQSFKPSETKLKQQDEKQFECALNRYHYLCAAIQKSYHMQDVPPDLSRGQLFPRQGLVFASYTPAKLQPVAGIKLHPRQDGTIHPGDIKVYRDTFRNSWKAREGGILYCIEEDERAFWNMILNYHSSAATTGIKVWDRLFKQLKDSNYDKALVPCMFFAREAGCLYPECPFLHDRDACIRDREKVLMARRVALGRPTTRDISLRERRQLQAHRAAQRQVVLSNPSGGEQESIESRLGALTTRDDFWDEDEDEELDPEVARIFGERATIRNICCNPDCLNVQLKKNARTDSDQQMKMKICTRCKVATYCSKECQVSDWKRHKKEPCLPFEEIVENDDLWDSFGQRKGTGDPRFVFSE